MHEDQCIHDGTCYPTNHLCAAFTDDADVSSAVAALHAAGFADLEWFHGAEAYDAIQQRRAQLPAILRVWRAVRNVGTEGDLHRLYLTTLRQGGSLVIVAAGSNARVEQARTILAGHHANPIWYLGAWAMERLPVTALA
jgi:hypothetical protein